MNDCGVMAVMWCKTHAIKRDDVKFQLTGVKIKDDKRENRNRADIILPIKHFMASQCTSLGTFRNYFCNANFLNRTNGTLRQCIRFINSPFNRINNIIYLLISECEGGIYPSPVLH